MKNRHHIKLAHSYWKTIVQPGDCVIDATCGNGYDTLYLAELALCKEKGGSLIALDLQTEAIEATSRRIQNALPSVVDNIRYVQQCHSSFPTWILPATVKLIVYNLGYLPGSDKTVTTQCDTTERSLTAALSLVCAGGMISVTCYPGHAEGKRETERVHQFTRALNPHRWNTCWHRSDRVTAPQLLLIKATG